MISDSAVHSLAGAAGGIVAMSATYPLVVLSMRSAVDTEKNSKSVTQTFVEIIEREGVAGLYSGLSSSLLGISVTNGVYYYFYERSRGAILNSRPGSKALSTLESMLAGVIAGSATTIISNPIWVVQTSQAVREAKPSESPSPSESLHDPQSCAVSMQPSVLRVIQVILAKEGLKGFFRGLGPALVLVINPVLQYTVFEQLKNFLVKRRAAKMKTRGAGSAVAVLTDLDFFFLGALSKLVATGATYPYIVIKSRLQAGKMYAKQYKSSLNGLATILKEEGMQGLYKGVGSKLLQSVLTAAILFVGQRRIYEFTKKVCMQVYHTEHRMFYWELYQAVAKAPPN